MQFTEEAWPGIADGSITVTFRAWKTARVRAGSTYRVAPGVIEVVAVDQLQAGSITSSEAERAGADLELLRERLDVDDAALVWRVEFRFVGADPRVNLRVQVPSGPDLDEAAEEVRAIDTRAVDGPWAVRSLELIAERPGERAPDLAAVFEMETLAFKRRIRRLKELGLTESLRIGYRLSARGRAVLDELRANE